MRKSNIGRITVAKRKNDKKYKWQVNVGGVYWQKHSCKTAAKKQAVIMRKINK